METILVPQEQLHITKATLRSLPYTNSIINKVIARIDQEKLTNIREDTLGVLFEKLIREQEKKDLGQFYTSQEIVNYIINFLDITSESKILDPTCGCGVFLVTAYNKLKQITPDAIDKIYGVDLNDSATKIARINLWLRNGRNSDSLKKLEKNIKVGNSIVANKHIDIKAFNWTKEFSEVLNNGGFDFIIGNPPYVTLKNARDYDLNESIFSEISNGNTNAASLVLAKSYELLREDGVMAFVLPKTLVRVNSYSRLREFLLNNSKILHILDLGAQFKDVRGEQIVLFVQKTKNLKQINDNKVLIRVFDNNKEFYVPQKIFQKYNAFLMFEDKKYYDLIQKITGESLDSIASIFRGISISPDSKLISKSKDKTALPIIKGNNISKVSYSISFFIDLKKMSGSSVKLEELMKKKIILQNIFSSEAGIISCVDNEGNLTFDTVTNIIMKDPSLELEYVYGLLNSKLLNFYLLYAIYNKSKLTMHTDRMYIGKLPIKRSNRKIQNEIIAIVKKMHNSGSKDLLSELDRKVYTLYGINKIEQHKIHLALKNIMSEKSFW